VARILASGDTLKTHSAEVWAYGRAGPGRGLTLWAEVLTLDSVLCPVIDNPREGFLKLRLRGAWLAAWFGLLAGVCVGQEQPAQSQPPENPTPQGQASQGQASQGGAGQSQGSPSQAQQGDSSSKDDSSSQTPAQQAPAEQNPTPKQSPSGQSKSGQSTPGQSSSGQSSSQEESSSQARKEAQQIPQNQSLITLDSNETIFSVLTALNACGYDQDLTISDVTRSNVRSEVQKVLADSEDAEASRTALCEFYETHVASRDPNRNLSQYISLALYMDGPPHFAPRVKEDDLPPDAGVITDFGQLLERFYEKAHLHSIWERHRRDYAAAMSRYHEPLHKMVLDTEVYLKQPSSQFLGRRFTIYLDFMGSPNETDARNYGPDYYIIVFPAPNAPSGETPRSALKMDEIRHTFLHYELDPLAEKHFTSIKRLEPLLQSVKRAPLEQSFKDDISLLVTECLIRAIEIRTSGGKQPAEEAMRAQAVDDAVKQGYILTRYFYNTMVAFEKDPVGIRGAYGDFLENIDLKNEQKAAAAVQFASSTAPELLRMSRPEERRMLVAAEKRLAAGDLKGAQELAQQALDKKIGDQGRALFILAEVAVADKNRDAAQDNFQKAIVASQDPKVIAWSHVYLGRILDMKEDREAALVQYKAALNAGGTLPEVKAAAEHGLAQAYEPPAKPQPQ
jgi:tetratricopeptide (TPR) repeat protein